MSETNVPYGTGAGSQRAWAPGSTGGDAGSDTTGVKDRASEAASRVGDAGRETAHDAKERARDVAHEATDRARGLVDRTRTELSSQMESQQQHLAGGLRSLGDELNQMAGGTQDPGYATDLVHRAGEASGHVAQWFEDRQPTDVLHEVEDFARRRPGTFVLLAAGAGLLVGRFLRGAKDASGEDDEGGPAGSGHVRRLVRRRERLGEQRGWRRRYGRRRTGADDRGRDAAGVPAAHDTWRNPTADHRG